MGKRVRERLGSEELERLWRAYRQGESVSAIARSLERPLSQVYGTLRKSGGIAPRRRQRSPRALRADERETISRLLVEDASFSRIAAELRRPVSTVSREVNRNGGRAAYRATSAEARAADCARRPKLCRLARLRKLRRTVAAKLRDLWSPQQISGWLKADHGEEADMQVSHEAIYRTLYVQTRGVLKQELMQHLRQHRRMRRPAAAADAGARRGQIVDAVPISERPPEVADRAVPGHWEGDLIVGSNNSYVITLVERHSRFVMLASTKSKDTASVVAALEKKILTLPEELRKSLTWDRGLELAGHKQLTQATNIKVFFCDPKSPWQKGSNENTNGLLRQYMPKGTDLSVHRQPTLDRIARQLNQRPRETLGFRTPAAVLQERFALTG